MASQRLARGLPDTNFMKQVWEAASFLAGSDQGWAGTRTALQFFNL